jgi:hypothetical protein
MASWTSFKDLLKLSESVILGRNHELFPDFESMLRKQQGNFYTILKNPVCLLLKKNYNRIKFIDTHAHCQLF